MGIGLNEYGCVVVLIGILIGVIGGFAASFEEAKEMEPLLYKNAWAQFFNRALFVVACILCLFVDFPGARDSGFNWLIFPIFVFVMLGICWFISFWVIIALKAVLRWVFASIVDF